MVFRKKFYDDPWPAKPVWSGTKYGEAPNWLLTSEEQAKFGGEKPHPLSFYSNKPGCGTYQQWQLEVASGQATAFMKQFRDCFCKVMHTAYYHYWHDNDKFLVVYRITFPLLPPPEPYFYIGETAQYLPKRLGQHRTDRGGDLYELFRPQSAIPGGMIVEIMRVIPRSGNSKLARLKDKEKARRLERREMSRVPYADIINKEIGGVRTSRRRRL